LRSSSINGPADTVLGKAVQNRLDMPAGYAEDRIRLFHFLEVFPDQMTTGYLIHFMPPFVQI